MESLIPKIYATKSFTNKAVSFLSHRNTSFFIVAVVILARVLQTIYFFNTRNDMTFQVLGAQLLLDGHGLSYTTISADDISKVTYHTLNQWPPGFSILFILFYLLFGKNYLLAAISLAIICNIILIFTCRSILKTLSVPNHFINLFTLMTGFFGYYFYYKHCTDSIAITFFILAVYFVLLLLKNNKHALRNTIALVMSLFIAGFIKYLFIPALFLIPTYLIAKGFFLKVSGLRNRGIAVFSALLIGYVLFFIYQKNSVGFVGYIREPRRGFYPSNLKELFPFITGSFVKTDTIEMLGLHRPLHFIFQLTSLLIFASLLIYCLKGIFKRNFGTQLLSIDFFYIATLLTTTLVILLSYLSINVAKEYDTWTYVEEPRYYGLINVLLHIGVFALYPVYKAAKSRSLRILFPALMILMIPEMLRGVVFTTNRILHLGKEKYGWQYELGFQKKADAIANVITEREKERKIILTGTSDWMTLRVSLYSHLPVFTDVNKLLSPQQLKTSKPVTLFAVIREDHMEGYKSFISLENVRFEGEANGFFFYSYNLNPQ